MTSYSIRITKASFDETCRALLASGWFGKPRTTWGRSELLTLQAPALEALEEKALALLRSDGYKVEVDLTTQTAEVVSPRGGIYHVSRNAPVGMRCTCQSEKRHAYQHGRKACKHYLAAFALARRLGLVH